jgi:membrane protease subunit HflK
MSETDPTSTASQFVTADQQMLETYVAVLWRVADPAKFYNHLSHSDFYAKSEGETTTKPIYEELVQQWTGFAVTRTFAIHTMDQIMTVDRQAVEAHCKQILQQKLDDADSGIQVMNLNITDLHPPLGLGNRVNPMDKDAGPLGPANAFEFIVDMTQKKEQTTQQGEKERIILVDTAQGDADKMVNDAKTYQEQHVAEASADAAQVHAVLNRFKDLPESEREFMVDLADRRARYSVLTDLLPPVNKVVVDPRVNNLDVMQATDKSEGLVRPPLLAPR